MPRLSVPLLALLALGVSPGLARGQQPPPPPAAARPVTVTIPFEKYTLDNGLEVILSEDHRTPVVATNVWYHVGSKDEPAGKNGFAHLFEHVMFQGSRHVGEDLFFKYLERAGRSDANGSTSTDRTNYFETLPSNQLELSLWLESDRMAFLLDHVDQKTFESQREVVKNERRQNYDNAPYGLVYPIITEALYPAGHPYHLTTIGTPKDLDAATLDDVKAFFRTFYVPNNATLVIAGDFDAAKTKELVGRYFGPILRGAAPPTKTAPVPVELTAEKRLRVEADVELGRLYLTWATPALFAPGDAELDVLSQVLTDGRSSRLQRRLVHDLEIAQSVSANQGSELLASRYEIVVSLKKGKTPEEALAVVDEELDKLRKAPPSDAEVERARVQILSGLVFGNERVTGRAERLNSYNQSAHDPGFIDKDLARYQAVRAADVTRAAASLLPPGKRVVTIVIPTPGAPRAGRLVGAP